MKKNLWLYGSFLIFSTIYLVACSLVGGMLLHSVLYLLGQAFAMVGALVLVVRFVRPLSMLSLVLPGLASVALALAAYVVLGRPRNNQDLLFLLSLDSLRLAIATLVGLVAIANARRAQWSYADLGAGLTLFALLVMALSDAAGRSHYLTGDLIIEGTPLAPGFAANDYCEGQVPGMIIVTAAALALGTMLGTAVRRRDARFAAGTLATACMLAASLLSNAR